MNYIVFDLEFNQPFKFGREVPKPPNPKCPFEIIDLGAVKLDEDFKVIETFDMLVRPKLYKRLHPFVKKITGITKASLNTAKPFPEVYEEFIKLIDDKSVLVVWGTADIKELIRNIEYHKLDSSIIPREYINIQQYASTHLESPSGSSIGLRNAVEILEIPLKDKFHTAFSDAWYTAEIFRKINHEDIKPKLYNGASEKKPSSTEGKKKLDTLALFRQFEKMLEREITEEEKTIIKLAYQMGKSNQFMK